MKAGYKQLMFFLIIFLFFAQPSKISAIQGTCSSHGGVNCSKFDSDGSAICNDGWIDSSVGYTSVEECNNCSSYLYHTGCKNKYDLDAIVEDYGRRGLTFSGMRIAAENKCNAEIQDYEGKQAKYEQCMDLRDEAARVRSNYLDTKLDQLFKQVNTTPQCPPNSSYSSITNNCPCDAGYVVYGNQCITGDYVCQSSIKDSKYNTTTKNCYCPFGYQFNDSKTSCIPIPQTTVKPQDSYIPPQRYQAPDPIELCIQKLGPHGIVAGQNLCGCVQDYVLNEARNSCVQQPVETKPSPVIEAHKPDIFAEFIKNNVKQSVPDITIKKDVEPKISSEPQKSNAVRATRPSLISATTGKADIQQKQPIVKRLGTWFRGLFK